MKGGLVLAPSGPGLGVDLVKSPAYRNAVAAADLVLIDSGALVLFWRLFTGEWLQRNSGLMFLRAVLAQPGLKRQGTVFWVMPSEAEQRRNLAWLATQGFSITADDCYVAPVYGTGEIADEVLMRKIEARRPQVVMVAIGGGVQEQLGHFLRQRLSYRPGIFCLGAAIAFLSGGQARIPPWADALMLGWLLRILYSPRRYAKRYWEAWALFPLLWRYREKMPTLLE
jgi:exopolysaccharide biosynthesis WecB/TagA/CpsF family protein